MSVTHPASPDPAAVAWLESWRSQSEDALTARFAARGATDPAAWAGSEQHEDIAQYTRFVLLRALWTEIEGAANELVRGIETHGAALPRSSVEGMVYNLAFGITYILGFPTGSLNPDGTPSHVRDDEPRWRVMETTPDGHLTGREVGALYESLGETAPGGGERWV